MASRPKIPKLPKPEPSASINTYGLKLVPGKTQLDYDRYAFKARFDINTGCPLRHELFWKVVEHPSCMPGHFERHAWTDRVVNTLCENSLSAYPGCSSAGKTFNVVSFAVAWWLMSPKESSVLLVSTTRDSLKKRGWAEVRKCYSDLKMKAKPGNLIDSRMMWQAAKGDDKHSIYGKAVEEGSVDKVADDIKGIHTKRQMVIIDEATSVPAAIYAACANLYSYPVSCGGEFLLVLIGNPLNRMDQFGRFCEPKDGWPSVSVDTGEWDGKAQSELGGMIPRIITFDATKSPNITEGRIVSRHLPTRAMVEAATTASGGGNTPLFWQNCRGFWPPGGITKTVFSQAIIDKFNATGKHIFTGRNFMIIGAFDPAFGGGDRPVLRFAKLGELQNGTWGIESLPPIEVPLDATSKNDVHYQLKDAVAALAKNVMVGDVRYECLPENMAVDATGEGGGLCDIMFKEWGPIIRVEFGGSPSEDCCSLEDSRPACDVYENKTTEMHFRAKNACASGQLRGVDKNAEVELCQRIYVDMRKDGTTAPKIRLQSKKEYKLLFKLSPDYGDSLVILLEVARQKGFRLAPTGKTQEVMESTSDLHKNAQAVYNADAHYSQDNEESYEEAA